MGEDIESAVDIAISELSENSVLKPFLMEHKAEVKHMCINVRAALDLDAEQVLKGRLCVLLD